MLIESKMMDGISEKNLGQNQYIEEVRDDFNKTNERKKITNYL